MNEFSLLIVDDDKQWVENICVMLRKVALGELTGQSYDRLDIHHVTNQMDASRAVEEKGVNGYDLILLDLLYPTTPEESAPEVGHGEFAGMKWLPELRRVQPNATIVIITAFPYENQLQNVVEAINRDHANDFIPKTSLFPDIRGRIRLAVGGQRRMRMLRMFELEFHALFRSRAASVLADDVGRLIDQNNAELVHIAQRVESGDPSAITNAPSDIRGLCRSLQERYRKTTSFFATIGEQHLRKVSLTKTVRRMVLLYARRFEEVGAKTIQPTEDDGVQISTYESDIKIALHEVLCNAADALKDCQTPVAKKKVEVTATADPGSKRAIVSVVDNGDGFSDEALAHIFEPRTSTRKDDRHQGIGLYIAKHMMQAIGGSIEARNNVEGGAEITLTIPDLAKP